jgi:hypothetical protein
VFALLAFAAVAIAAIVVGVAVAAVVFVAAFALAAFALVVRAVLPPSWRRAGVRPAPPWPHETIEATAVKPGGQDDDGDDASARADTHLA